MKSYLKTILDLLTELILWQAIRVMVILVPASRWRAVVTNKEYMPAQQATREIWLPLSKWLSCFLESVKWRAS
ncbi:MAG: hypothetical protein HRU12_24480 [Phaeodactylibacter sp.]|nr:hypothetical protein [Phaeodactylibacter sp.]